jgi:subtilisin family serine protease
VPNASAGAAPGTRLFSADIYCDSPTGGSADKIAGALGWMARARVGVVNISLVGPPNALLERVVAAMVARGHLLVAAVGNDGPAAPPLYPASYPGVVGVTGVDRQGRPLPEAARGPQVMFAAPGSQMVSAAPGTPPYRQVRGTSFAAPIVAALLSKALPQPDRAAAARALALLAGAGRPRQRSAGGRARAGRGRRRPARRSGALPLKNNFLKYFWMDGINGWVRSFS